MNSHSSALLALVGVSLSVVAASCGGEDEGGDKDLEFVDAGTPEPLIRYPLEGAAVTGLVFIDVLDAKLTGKGLKAHEIPELRESAVSAEYSTDGGLNWVPIVEDAELPLPFEPEVIGWNTTNVDPGPGREALLRITITDDQNRSGSEELALLINKAPVVTGIVIEDVDSSGADPVFTLSAEAFDPDDEVGTLQYEWHFQWDGTSATGQSVVKTVPAELLETAQPAVAMVHVTDQDLGHGEDVGTLLISSNGVPAQAPSPTYCTCEPPGPTAIAAGAINTVKPLPVDPLDRVQFLIDSAGNFTLAHGFIVDLPVSGDPRLCRHWQNVKAAFTYQGAAHAHRERKPAAPGVTDYHATEPPLQEGRPCGLSDPFCVDGYLYVPDTENTIHAGSSILFLDAPGWHGMLPGMFYDTAFNPVGVGVDAVFQAHCRGTDGSATVDTSYSFSAHVDMNGAPNPAPTFTP